MLLTFTIDFSSIFLHSTCYCRMNFNQMNTWHIHYKNALLEFSIVLKLATNITWELILPLRERNKYSVLYISPVMSEH